MTWSNPPTQFISEAEREYGRMLRGAALDIYTRIIERSPVITGRFRGNNMVSVGSPSDAIHEEDYPQTRQAALAEGRATIEGIDNPFTIIYIQNNIVYAQSVERKHGVYETTINSVADNLP